MILLVQVESLILRLASKFPGRRDQLLFLINNYDVVRLKHHIIYKREVWFFILLGDVHHHRADEGRFEGVWNIPGAAEKSKWRVRWADAGTALWSAYWVAQKFIAQLTVTLKMYSVAHICPIFRWLKDAERKLDAGDTEGLRQEERRVSLIIQNFSADWKKSLDLINGIQVFLLIFVCLIWDRVSGEIMTSFPNLKLGTGILQQSLTQLVQYYHRWWWIFRVLIPCLLQVILDFDHSTY